MIQRLAASEIFPARLPKENVTNGLLPIGKNALKLKMDNRISDFPHGEKWQFIIYIIIYQCCPIRFSKPMGMNPHGVWPPHLFIDELIRR